ncbi:MAG TPA: BrnT family toxin [Longimicrobium sp.]|jgi:hypothetical protein
MGFQFEWDPVKAAANLRVHGVSFAEASTAFGDPFAQLLPDPDHSGRETRYLLLGVSELQHLLVVCHTERRGATIRIISARKANRSERQKYEEEI